MKIIKDFELLHYEFSSVLGRINSNFPNHCFPQKKIFLILESEIILQIFLNSGFEPETASCGVESIFYFL